MSLYKGNQTEVLLALIKEANPNLPFELTPTNCRFGTPVDQAVAPGTFQDTSIQVIPTNATQYTGGMQVKYRRINLTNLFLNQRVVIRLWSSLSYLTADQIVEYLNDTYGLALVREDLTSTTYLSGSSSTRVSIAANSKNYKGSFILYWEKPKQPLTSKCPEGPVTGLTFFSSPQANPDPAKPVGELMVYGVDFTPNNASLEGVASGSALASGSSLQAVLTTFNNQLGGNLSLTDSATRGGLGGLTATRYTLPHSAVPEANSEQYSKVLVVTAKDTSWFTGRILFHYN